MAFLAGDLLTAAKLNFDAYARFERQTGTQNVLTNTDTQIQYPIAVYTDPNVVNSGTSNNAFTLSEGLWIVTWGLRVSTVHASWETTCSTGSTTWAVSGVQAAGAISGQNGGGSVLVDVPDGTTKAVTFGSWQASTVTYTIAAFGHGTHCEFARIKLN